jgi:hypothetical protein
VKKKLINKLISHCQFVFHNKKNNQRKKDVHVNEINSFILAMLFFFVNKPKQENKIKHCFDIILLTCFIQQQKKTCFVYSFYYNVGFCSRFFFCMYLTLRILVPFFSGYFFFSMCMYKQTKGLLQYRLY